jgi:hypothetical protein
VAVITSVPEVNVDVVTAAIPFTSATVPRLVKLTEPVAVLGVTVEVKVMLCPTADGLLLDVKTITGVVF